VAKVYVARHGESEYNREGRYQGRRESALTPLGRRQAAALAEALAASAATRVISSPLGRSVETARPIAQRLGIALEVDARLIEIALGEWEGRLRVELEREDPSQMAMWQSVPHAVQFEGGESVLDVDARWRSFAATCPADVATIVVTHDILVRLAILAATNRPLARLWDAPAENGAYTLFEVENGQWRLIDECAAEHLAGIRADLSRQAL
jgi:broad specificity phosphatase PhoE